MSVSSLSYMQSLRLEPKRIPKRVSDAGREAVVNQTLSVEILSRAILALQCVERDHRNRNVKPLLKKPLTSLSVLQQHDGGFGSLHSTALAIQVNTATRI